MLADKSCAASAPSALQPALPHPDRVVIINDVSVVRGGATSIALLSARLLVERGVPVMLLTGDAGEGAQALPAAVTVLGAGSAHIVEGGRVAAGLRGLYNIHAERLVRRWIAENDTPGTVYHLHGWSKILSPAIFRALRPVAGRTVATVHDFFLACPNGGYFDYKREQPCHLRPMSAACLMRNCDKRKYSHKVWRVARLGLSRAFWDINRRGGPILPVHDGMIPLLERGGLASRRMRTLRNPATPWRHDRVAAEDNQRFVYVGRLEEDKGVLLLASAARRARVPLAVIGTGPLASKLAAEFPEVEQFGWRTRDEIADLIGDARVFVMPTRVRETFGLAIIEALSSGLPVVVPNYAMLADEVVTGGFGLTCDPHDTDALAAVLSRLAQDNDLVAAMSQRAHAQAQRLAPTPEEWINGLLALYAEMLGRTVRSTQVAAG